jgi:hypothetical protein
MIAESKEVQEWNLDINVEPDTIEARVLKRPIIFSGSQQQAQGQNKGYGDPMQNMQPPTRPLDDTKILGTIVH